MRGPNEELDANGATAARSTARRVRAPGGKAAFRLATQLRQIGLDAGAGLPTARLSADTLASIGLADGDRARRVSPARAAAAAEQAAADYAEALAGAAAETGRLGPPTLSGPQWRPLGPWTIPNGQTYGAARINVSGRISAIAVDPSSSNHVLAGAANGGVWESFDRGASWAPRTDYQLTTTVGAIAFDPSSPLTVLCGTGEGNWWSWLGQGVLRSADGGTTWTLLSNALRGQGFFDLRVDPADGAHVLAATTGGLWESHDGGVSWTQCRAATTWSLALAMLRRPEWLAACADGIYTSNDGGTTWSAVALSGAPATFQRAAVAVAPSNPEVAYVWASDGSSPLLWRRSGATWTAISPPPGVDVGQDWYDWFLAAAPDVDTQVYLGAIDAYRGDLSGGTWSWIDISSKGAGADSIHPDQHAIAFDPADPNSVYVGSDGGLFHSPDRGVAWRSLNNGLAITEFEYLAEHPGSSRWIIGGTQDNGTERWIGTSWEHSQDGDGGDCAVNRADPNTVFHTFFGMSPERSTTQGSWGSWADVHPNVPAGEANLFYPPMETCATAGSTVALGGGALYVSRDNAATWTRLAFPAVATASAMYIPTPDVVYVATTDGRLYRTSWSGSSWGALSALTAPRAGAWVSDIYADSADTNRVWVTHSRINGGRIWQSTDGGASWADRTAALPNLPVNAIQVDPANRNRIWVALDVGVRQSVDGGLTWTDFSASLPNAVVGDLIFHEQARVLRAGLRNRGVWEIPVDGWPTQPICGVQWNGSLGPHEMRRWFTFNWPASWHVIWTVIPTTPLPGAPEVTWNVQVERATAEFVTYWIDVSNLTNSAIDFEGRFCILSRY